MCGLCLRTDRPLTREHVFARWLIRQVHGSRLVATAPAAEPRRIARVTAVVCAVCNHGWMSGLEVAFRRIVFAPRPRAGPIPAPDRVAISRWFTKTALLLADADGRELVPANVRPKITTGMPDGVEVFVARRRRPRQQVDFSFDSSAEGAMTSVAILIDDLVGHVAPRDNLTSRAGTRLWPLRTHSLRWETLPVIS